MKTQFWKKCFEQVWSKKLQKSKKKPKSPIFLRFQMLLLAHIDIGVPLTKVKQLFPWIHVNVLWGSTNAIFHGVSVYNVIMAINSRLVTYSHVHTSSWWWDEQVCLKRRKMHVILCRVVLYIKRKNFFTVCNWCLLSACVSKALCFLWNTALLSSSLVWLLHVDVIHMEYTICIVLHLP